VRNTKGPYLCVYLCFWSYDLPDFAHREYLPELARVRAQREATLQKQKEDSTARMLADLAVDRASGPSFAAQDRWNPDEEEEEEDDGGELNIIDRSASFISGHSAFPPSVTPQRVFQRNAWRHVVRQSRRGSFGVTPFGFLG
jgi:hypothetical protein